MTRSRLVPHARRRGGFTLVELLIVITIVLLISAVTLPLALQSLNQRRVGEAALTLQAELARARDLAIRDNAPRGFRLFLDEDPTRPGVVTASRMISIEPGSDYSEGRVIAWDGTTGTPPFPNPITDVYGTGATNYLIVFEAKTDGGTPLLPRPPTSWYWNIRQGDKIRFAGSDQEYTIVGPMRVGPNQAANAANTSLTTAERQMTNPERYINMGTFVSSPSNLLASPREFLILTNGVDDDSDGYTDEAFDFIDNDADGVTDPGFNGLNDNPGVNAFVDEPLELFIHAGGSSTVANEFEAEVLLTTLPTSDNLAVEYTITRRPVPAKGARELALPTGVVLDLTTWNATPERSQLPVDPATRTVDIMIAPGGQAVRTVGGRAEPIPPSNPFFHFWLTDVEDVFDPIPPPPASLPSGLPYRLPMPEGTLGYPVAADTSNRVLKANRRLVSLNTQTGQVVTTTVENFNIADIATNPAALARPFLDAQSGVKEVP